MCKGQRRMMCWLICSHSFIRCCYRGAQRGGVFVAHWQKIKNWIFLHWIVEWQTQSTFHESWSRISKRFVFGWMSWLWRGWWSPALHALWDSSWSQHDHTASERFSSALVSAPACCLRLLSFCSAQCPSSPNETLPSVILPSVTQNDRTCGQKWKW